MVQEVAYLGHLLTSEGVRVDPAKTSTIRNLAAPRDVHGLQHVLGLFQHYAKFHPNYATMTAPLTDLTQKGHIWQWTEQCQ